jgi:DNA-binding beta-propeller fold protein YncE
MTEGTWLDEPARKVKDAAAADALWPTFGDAGDGVDAQSFFENTQPTFGAPTSASDAPPPISGGTLIVTRDGTRAIASDPDRDLVYIVDISQSQLHAQTVALQKGDEPGRLVEDGAGRVHIALRGSGALVTIDGMSGTVLARRSACPAPRGVDWDSTSDYVYLACATGELVAFPASGGDAIARWVVERDLRDVSSSNGMLSVTSFRAAQVLRIAGGEIGRRDQLPSPASSMAPQVVWRSVRTPSGALVTVHQSEALVAVPPHQGGYGDGAGCNGGEGPPPLPPPSNAPVLGDASVMNVCPDDADAGCLAQSNPVVRAVLTVMRPDGSVTINRNIPASVPVDVAVSRDGKTYAVAAAGNAFTQDLGTVLTFGAECGNIRETPRRIGSTSITPTAVAFDAKNNVLVQTREPAALWVFDAQGGPSANIILSTTSRQDTGVDIFHTQAGALMACAGCHPEGGDDGHVWMLDGKPRRTPSLRGTIAGTAPYHWPGDESSLDSLVFDVYTQRMSGAFLEKTQLATLENWVQAIPAPKAPSWLDASSVQRGAAIFASTDAGCSTCHSGAKLTNNQSLDVGTGGAFQVPPLVGVGWRTPLLHDGCAHTILDRFGKCSTQGHGSLGGLTPANITDLASYLESL